MKDSFEKQPVEIGHVSTLRIIFDVTEGEEENTYAARYDFLVGDDHRTGDLIPHLTTTQRNAAKSFLNAMLAKAQEAGE